MPSAISHTEISSRISAPAAESSENESRSETHPVLMEVRYVAAAGDTACDAGISPLDAHGLFAKGIAVLVDVRVSEVRKYVSHVSNRRHVAQESWFTWETTSLIGPVLHHSSSGNLVLDTGVIKALPPARFLNTRASHWSQDQNNVQRIQKSGRKPLGKECRRMLPQWLKRLLGRPDKNAGDAKAPMPSDDDIELAMEAWQDGWDGWVQAEPSDVARIPDTQSLQDDTPPRQASARGLRG